MNTRRTYFWIAFLALALGTALCGLYWGLDLGGFLGGMCSGAGVALIILAAYIFGRSIWWERGPDSTQINDWLPSRDREDRP